MLDLNLPLKIFFLRVISIRHQKHYCLMATLQKYTHKKSDKEEEEEKGQEEEKRRGESPSSTLTLEDISILAVQQGQGKEQDKKGSPGFN